jgi:hypothetical protein
MDTERERQGLQDLYNQQAINAQQRVDILQQRDYWRGVLQDPATEENRQLQRMAQENLDRLDGEYSTLLADYGRLNNEALERSGGEPTPEQESETPFGGPPPPGPGETTDIAVTNWVNETLSDNLDIPKTRLNDSVEAVKQLVGDDIPEGYNYEAEIELINRYFSDSSKVTLEEFNRVQETDLKRSLHNYLKHVGINVFTNLGGMTTTMDFDNEDHKDFVDYLLETGTVTPQQVTQSGKQYRITNILQAGVITGGPNTTTTPSVPPEGFLENLYNQMLLSRGQ